MNNLLPAYEKLLLEKYPSTAELSGKTEILRYLLSSEVVPVPASVYQQIEKCVSSLYQFAHSNEFIESLQTRLPPEEQEILRVPARNASVLMAYDFHLDLENHTLTLIEVNTNASNFLTCDLLYQRYGSSPWESSLSDLRNSFFSEWTFSEKSNLKPRIAIVDEDPPKQKMMVEFLMYRDLFQSWGWSSKIFDVTEVPLSKVDFIYNRYTDFLLSSEKARNLKSAYKTQSVLFSPHPREYLLLASKDRLIDFYNQKLSPALAPVMDLASTPDADEIWSRRKSLFFKPKQMFGTKAVYRGESISRRIFQEIISKNYIAQEYRPAGLYKDWKFDLRFFAYQDRIQLGCARLYKGQVTNLQTLGGGLARLAFV